MPTASTSRPAARAATFKSTLPSAAMVVLGATVSEGTVVAADVVPEPPAVEPVEFGVEPVLSLESLPQAAATRPAPITAAPAKIWRRVSEGMCVVGSFIRRLLLLVGLPW